jgi:methionyl-tRNA synthetase
MERLDFRKATAALRSTWAEGNVYLEEREPWRAIKTDRDTAAMTLRTALGFCRVAAVASCPFIPAASERLGAILPQDSLGQARLAPALADTIATVTPGSPFAAPGLLFGKLDDDQLAAWAERFGGDDG